MTLDNIPAELRALPQWVVWRYEDTDSGKPTKVPYSPRTGRLASVTDPSTWSTFDEARAAVENAALQYNGTGFVFTDTDPFAFIDLDDPQGDQATYERQLKVYHEFDSYSEVSPSGKGLHIIVKGHIPAGRRRSNIEVYASLRYATMTGNVYQGKTTINERQSLLQLLWTQMGGGVAQSVYHGDDIERTTDDEVIKRALNAHNGDKFAELLHGNWRNLYQSQSEADIAFIDIIAFYTQNRNQISRLFYASPLGQREKARRIDYVAGMVNKSFDRMLPPVDIDGLRNAIEDKLAAELTSLNRGIERTSLNRGMGNDRTSQMELFTGSRYLPPADPTPNVGTVPPGLLGDIARFIYAASPRPVPEIALAGAIGLMAGIVGRAYNVSGTGLNQYIMLLSATGTGKEAMALGINRLMASIRTQVPASAGFIGPGNIRSDAALLRHMSKHSQCFVSLVGEFGSVLDQMTSPYANVSFKGLQTLLRDLYHKSGSDQMLQSTIYSDKDKSIDPIKSPALTILGEGNPEEFYGVLDDRMISGGLLPRFLLIQYNGLRVPLNEAHTEAQPTLMMVEQFATLCAHCLTLMHGGKTVNVRMDTATDKLMRDFDKYADDRINSSRKEVISHLWNRAHLKALKLAALVAVGVQPYEPVITLDIAEWATSLVQTDTFNLVRRFERGEIGRDSEESKQISEIVRAISFYVKAPYPDVSSYSVPAKLHNDKIIPYVYLNKKLVAAAAFRNDRIGATNSLKRTIQTLVDNGDIREVGRNDLAVKYGYNGKAFMVSNTALITT